MKRGARVWLVFGACVVVTVAALAWVSFAMLRIDAAERQARADATFEERVRLALWRMDAQAAAMLAAEAAIPPSRYAATPIENEWVAARFDIDADGATLRSGAKSAGDVATPVFATFPPGALDQLPEVAATAPPVQIATFAPSADELPQQSQEMAERQVAYAPAQQVLLDNEIRQQQAGQSEYQARQRAVNDGWSHFNRENFAAIEAQAGAMAPLWVDGRLLLARRLAGDAAIAQGCALDVERLRAALLGEARDLLPDARLTPTAPRDSENRRLVALPLTLDPGKPQGVTMARSAATRPLALAWIGVLLATIASAALLRGVLRLSERRAAFVSAVTHELRTPLTTFQLYTEMLRDGMTDESQRVTYLTTLNHEAERLSHLVENVLAYARLERQSLARRAEPTSVADLLRRMRPRLEARAAEAGGRLQVEIAPGLPAARLVTSAVEQIMVNLVDNACKYARRNGAAGRGPEVRVAVTGNGRFVEVCVSDDGPGIGADRRGRIFEPFHKSAEDAAGAAPGVGIGLSLSRRLARDLAGDLELERTDHGASFVLRLPVDGAPSA